MIIINHLSMRKTLKIMHFVYESNSLHNTNKPTLRYKFSVHQAFKSAHYQLETVHRARLKYNLIII